MQEPRARHDAYAALRIPAFLWLLLGSQVVSIGTAAQGLAIGWEIYARTNDPFALGEQGLSQVSETALTLRAGCTRRAMHLALENLETSGLIVRKRQGRSYAISLCQGAPSTSR